MLIGICGKSGSGKTTLSNELKSINNNIVSLDIDKIGHESLKNPIVIKELTDFFGNGILLDGVVNRKELSKAVFTDPSAMKVLTNITWKYMQFMIDEFINDNKNRIIILDWLLLPNTEYFKKCDIKILLDVDYNTRMNRSIKRDNISENSFKIRDHASIEYNSNDFDYVINDGNYDEIKSIISKL